jgi:hypothetical protein
MHLTPQAIAEYQAIHLKEFGEEISASAAEKRGKEICEFYKLLINYKYRK